MITIIFTKYFLWFFKIVLLTSSFPQNYAFNLDAKFPLFFKSSVQKVFFGYSVEYYVDNQSSWIAVGAPKNGDNGKIFKCNVIAHILNGLDSCEIINLNYSESPQVEQMLGSTLTIGRDKQLLTCAPKFSHYNPLKQVNLPIGACYLLDNFLDNSTETFTYSPCINMLGNDPDGQEFGFCQFGLSASFVADNNQLLVGAVGSYYNQGSIMLFDEGNLLENHYSLPRHTGEKKPPVPPDFPDKESDYYRQTFDNNYMGYTVASGRTSDGKMLLATSAPRRFGLNLVGAVIIYYPDLKDNVTSLFGEQIGEYFGHGVAFVDINNDGLDDLVIGSPFYSDTIYRQPEIGRIYVYYQNIADETVEFTKGPIINGNATLGRFGNTITSLGDVNSDGYQDFLVSSPYESNGPYNENSERFGALYLFNGGENGVVETPSQIIHGASLENINGGKNLIRGLGFSLKGGKDLDKNGYPDIVTGAYLSDQAVVIRARPVVKLSVTSKITPKEVDLEAQSCDLNANVKSGCFSVQFCFSYAGKKVPNSIDFSFTYDVDSTKNENEKRTYLLDSSHRNMTLASGEEKCQDEVVYIKRDIKDKLSNVSVKVSYKLQERNEPVEPVLDVLTGSSSATVVADIYKHCGSDNICTPELHIYSTVNPSTVYVGGNGEFTIRSSVSNKNENAYQTLLFINLPVQVSYIRVKEHSRFLTHCTETNRTVMCEVANPLKQDENITIDVLFSLHDIESLNKLNFEVFANCSNEKSFQTPSMFLELNIDEKADIVIFSASVPQTISLDSFSESDRTENLSIPVSHTYQITNDGPSTVSLALISLFWPLRTNDNRLLLGLDQVITNGPVICNAVHVINTTNKLLNSISSGDEKTTDRDSDGIIHYNCANRKSCPEINCTVTRFPPRENSVSITLKGSLRVFPLFESDHDSMITSDLVFEISRYITHNGDNDDLYFSEVSTSAVYPPVVKPLEWWIVALAVGGGVLFLLIIILILWRCGFFKRKTIPLEEENEEEQQVLHQAELKKSEGLH